jgi:hypothetical protein
MDGMEGAPKWFTEAYEVYDRCFFASGNVEPRNGEDAHDLGCQGLYGDLAVHTDEEFIELSEKYNIDDKRSSGKISKIIINTLNDSNLEVFVGALMGSINGSDAPSFCKDFVKDKGYSADKYRNTFREILLESEELDIKEAYRLHVKFLMKYSPQVASDTASLMYNFMTVPGSKYFDFETMAAVNVMTINIIHNSMLDR